MRSALPFRPGMARAGRHASRRSMDSEAAWSARIDLGRAAAGALDRHRNDDHRRGVGVMVARVRHQRAGAVGKAGPNRISRVFGLIILCTLSGCIEKSWMNERLP